MSTKKFTDKNLYELVGVEFESNQAAIRKAYRKKALECHPDKNPDNPKAAELFHELSEALEILTDPIARAAYDKVFRAKKAAQLRNLQLDSKRQKLKADLEQRERYAETTFYNTTSYSTNKTDEEKLQAEIERLRMEGSRLLEEEHRIMREQLKRTIEQKQNTKQPAFDSSQHRIKIKWNAEKTDTTNGGYTEEILVNYLKKYGEIVAFVMSQKKKGSALIEFKTLEAGEMAILYEKGSLSNPLKLEWIVPPKQKEKVSSLSSTNDLETLVMRKLRQAEERKRLIEQMQKEDENT